MLIGELFDRPVTRAIPPVVFFHEQDPPKLEQEVSEYIITGGYPAGDPRATEGGIHEQLVRLLRALRRELDRQDQSGLPASWISGFYGSGKSSFAKLLGLALDGRQLPSGQLLSEAILAQDHSPQRLELARAWGALIDGLKPMGVVFDVGSEARDNEHVHSVVVRQAQRRFGYCSTSHLVAEYELKLELEGSYGALLEKVREAHGKPWSELKDNRRADDYFSAALHRLQPDVFRDPMSWIDSRVGSAYRDKGSVSEALQAIAHMLQQRRPGRTLFIVVDEVSQYVHDNEDRMLALQSFVSALGQQLKGQAWLLATGQQRLEESAGHSATLSKLKDRFPPALRVHLGTANIRDVVHRRLLRKRRRRSPGCGSCSRRMAPRCGSMRTVVKSSPRRTSWTSTRFRLAISTCCCASRAGYACAPRGGRATPTPSGACCSCSVTSSVTSTSNNSRLGPSSRSTASTTSCTRRSTPTSRAR